MPRADRAATALLRELAGDPPAPLDPRAEPSAADQARFRDPETGAYNVFAHRAAVRAAADLYYLGRWKSVGIFQAAHDTCERFGHDGRAGRCERCGAGLGRRSE